MICLRKVDIEHGRSIVSKGLFHIKKMDNGEVKIINELIRVREFLGNIFILK